MTDTLRKLILSGGGLGYLPLAPGTWASLAPCAAFLLLAWAVGGGQAGAIGSGEWLVAAAMVALAVLSGLACVVLGQFAERAFGKKDSRRCVIDEYAGQAVTLVGLPLWAGGSLVLPPAVAFLAFRAMDIIKPPPGRRLERLPFGWGVLLDDVVAGVYANVLCQLILRVGLRA
ncbi:MAG: phosphatidylglycerophosphatase A [Phycisphaerae bacterium]|nr:phosphatidylglycerophosphatase A [Phycisphaerae bacterium]